MLRSTLNLVNKCRLINSRNLKTVSGKPSIQERELYPFDYDSIPSDFDGEVYKRLLNEDDAFGAKKLVDVKELFDNRCHFGHKTGSLNDYMKPYIFGHRQGITIFDLNQTAEHLKKALDFAAHIAFRDGIILFINPSREVRSFDLIKVCLKFLFLFEILIDSYQSLSLDRSYSGKSSFRM